MEQKKEILLKILEKLKPYRKLANGFITVIHSKYNTEQTMDELTKLITDALTQENTKQDHQELKKGFDTLKKIQKLESQDQEDHDQKLSDILQNI